MRLSQFLTLLATLLFPMHHQAQQLYMLSRGSITSNDSLTGYYFLYETDRYNRDTNSYLLEVYNRNLVLSQKSVFRYPKNFEFVSCRLPGGKAYIHFRNYHRDANGRPKPRKVESQMIVYDLNKQAITKHIVFPRPKLNTLYVTEKFSFTHLNSKYTLNCSYDKELKKKQVLYLLNNNLDTLWKSWLNDDDAKYCAVTQIYPLNDEVAALEIAKGRDEWDIYGNSELRIISLKDGAIIQKIPLNVKADVFAHQLRSTYFDRATQTLLLAGNYLSRKQGAFGTKYYNQGIFVTSIDLRDFAKPLINKKIFFWKQDLKINLFDTMGKLNENDELDLKKVVSSKGRVQVVMGFNYRSMNAAMSGWTNPFSLMFDGSSKNIAINSSQMMERQMIPLPENGQEISPKMLLREALCVVALGPSLELKSVSPLSEIKDVNKLKFHKYKRYNADIDFQYYPDNASMNILALFHPKGSQDEGKPVLASLLYEQDGTCKTDELPISPDADWTEFYKARPGYVTIVEYFEKEHKLVPRVEKLNY